MKANSNGFTLLELLVAISIFSLIAAAGYSGLSSLARALQSQQESSRTLADTQWLVARLDQDIAQSINRPTRVGGIRLPALVGDSNSLRLVTLSAESPVYQALSDEIPVGWQWQNQQLRRQLWQLPDRAAGTAPLVDEILMEQILQFEFRYLDDSNQWQLQWNSQLQNSRLPRAIQYQLQTSDYELISRIIELPGQRQ